MFSIIPLYHVYILLIVLHNISFLPLLLHDLIYFYIFGIFFGIEGIFYITCSFVSLILQYNLSSMGFDFCQSFFSSLSLLMEIFFHRMLKSLLKMLKFVVGLCRVVFRKHIFP